MSAETILQHFPATVPGWTVTQTGMLRAALSKVARPGANGAPKDPWGRSFEAGSLHEVTVNGATLEFRGMVRVRGTPVEVQIINA